jgi:hypothetical protein
MSDTSTASACISVYVECWLCSSWNTWTIWSSTTDVATGRDNWVLITQLGTSWSSVKRWRSIHRDEWLETIYESGTMKITISHQIMKGTAPNINAFVAIQEKVHSGHSSLLNSQWQGSSTSTCYVDGQCYSCRRTFQTWNRAWKPYGVVSGTTWPETDGLLCKGVCDKQCLHSATSSTTTWTQDIDHRRLCKNWSPNSP